MAEADDRRRIEEARAAEAEAARQRGESERAAARIHARTHSVQLRDYAALARSYRHPPRRGRGG